MLLLSLTAVPARAQYVFSSLYPRDGLSSKEVFCSYTDNEGFLWCGTPNGLNRWDGAHFQVITPYSETYPGLLNEAVYAITGWHNQLWVGTHLGLSVLDKRKGRFHTIPFIRDGDTLRDMEVRNFHITKDDRLWVSTQNGLFFYDKNCMMPVSNLLKQAATLDAHAAYVFDGGGSAIWVRADTSIYFLDPPNGIFYSPANNPLRWGIFAYKHIISLVPDDTGGIWFAAYHRSNGLYRFSRTTGMVAEEPGFEKKNIFTLYNDGHGRLWISGSAPQAWVFYFATGKRLQLPDGEGGLSYALFHQVHEDAAGNLWFATSNGISKLPAVQPLESIITLPQDKLETGERFSLVNNLQTADSGHIWVCKDDGLYLMSLADYSFRRTLRVNRRDAKENRFFDIQRINGQWWCGNGDGIHIFDPATGSFTPFTHYPKDRMPWHRSAMWIQQDGEGNIWYASWLDAVYRYSPATDESIRIVDSTYGDVQRRKRNWLFGFRDGKGRMWFNYGDKGLRRWDAASRKMINPIPPGPDREAFAHTISYNMIADGHGGYWLSTNRLGAVQIDSNGHILQTVSLKQGLHTTAALFVWLQPDDRHLWIATSEGIQTFETSRRLLSAIDLDFGIMVQDYGSIILGHGDKAYISINGRLAVINLKANTVAAVVPRPLITGVRVFEADRPVPPPDSSLRLRYNENFFTIEFSSPLHRNVPALQYAYRLDGFDKHWVACGRRQSAAYTDVPPGRYLFRVRTTNELGEWQKGETTIHISIRAPFWQQFWFKALWLAALGIILYYLVRYIHRRRQRQRIASTIEYFANSVYGENSVVDICWDISRNCTAQMRLEDCVIYLRDDVRPVLHQVAAYGPKNPQGHMIENPIEVAVGEGIVGVAAQTGKPICVSDTRKDPRYLVDDAQRLSELAVPIIHDGEVIGVIDTEHSRKGFYKEAHVKALTTIASICANKIAEAQAEASVRENERELLQIRSMLADSQLMALRTQMNPHFVFNSLNSIQECIVTGKYGEASHYLNKFSKLFRALLENSSKPLIPLAEEIAVLELYLSLEHMRFEGSFEYHIDVDDELETEEIMIPSMLLQPFVENALWHGLMHKDGARRLTLSFEVASQDTFRCTIDDNGIGREKAAELKAARATGKTHISRGLQITNDRIALMQRRGQTASIRIIDKYNSTGKPTGTAVVVELSAYLTTLES